MSIPTLSIIIISFNTKAILERCLKELISELDSIPAEIIVVDNDSKDGSPERIAYLFPTVKLIKSTENLGFAKANNLGYAEAKGKYIILLNSDAFIQPGGLNTALIHMEKNPDIGLAGARLVGEDGAWQPSSRLFPSTFNNFLMYSGMASRYSNSRFFARMDRPWANPTESIPTDWVPGAFMIMRKDLIDKIGLFDPRFFMYYEEVDLCKRVKKAGYEVWYFGNVKVIHLGGESSKTHKELELSFSSQLLSWEARSCFLYYRKHGGICCAWCEKIFRFVWYKIRSLKNGLMGNQKKKEESERLIEINQKAWIDTQGGRVSPPAPW